MTAPICFLDTETTSLRPDRQAWEIAMIRRDDQGETETCFMVDVDLSGSDPFALKIGGFYERHPYGKYLAGNAGINPSDLAEIGLIAPRDGYLTRPTAAITVARLTHGAHIVGAVPNFDTEVLGQLLRDHRLTPAWHYHLIDVEALAVGYLAMQGKLGIEQSVLTPEHLLRIQPPWSSDDLTLAIGVEPSTDEERHTALGDARWAMRMYDAITGGADG